MAQWLKDQVCNWRIAGFLSVPVLSQQKKKCFGFGLDQEVMRLVFNTRVFHRFLKCNNSDLAVKFVCLRNRNCWCSDLCPPLEVFTFFFLELQFEHSTSSCLLAQHSWRSPQPEGAVAGPEPVVLVTTCEYSLDTATLF